MAVAASVLAALTTAALADVKAGVDAWATGNYAAAVREWQGPSAAGDPDAQFNLAQAYKLGRGVPRDLARAEALYASAAAKGHLQASDNYGLLLFQRGERARAMPYIQAAAGRGDARAQYILGLALFNGDGMAKDWVRAYALVSLAQQAGLPQASGALAQMDQHVSMADRQKSVAVASRITAEADSTRARQVAASDLAPMPGARTGPVRPNLTTVTDGPPPVPSALPAGASTVRPKLTAKDRAGHEAARAASVARDVSANRSDQPAASPDRRGPPVKAAATTPQRPVQAPPAATGPWNLQLGAFGVPGNAQALWTRVKGRPELAGRGKQLAPSGKLTRLLATGFASQSDATAACAKLKSGGFTCLATRD
jgi:hypothetical protein